MMKKKILLILFLSLVIYARGQQKQLVDTGMLGGWPYISSYEEGVVLSGDGHYAAYIIYNHPVKQQTLIIKDLRGAWEKKIICSNARLLFFSSDSRQLCWEQGDSIWLQQVGNDKTRLLGVSNAISFPLEFKGTWMILPANAGDSSFRLINLLTGHERTFASVISHRWLAGGYKLLLNCAEGRYFLLDLNFGKEHAFAGVKDVAISPDNKTMILHTGTGNTASLEWVRPGESRPVRIWTGQPGEHPGEYVFDKANEQLAFSVQAMDKKVTIWYYKISQRAATLKIADESTGFMKDRQVSGIFRFSDNGRWLLFNVHKKAYPLLPVEAVSTSVDIWSYRDEVLNPAQIAPKQAFTSYMAVMNVNSKKIQLLQQQEDERVISIAGNYIVIGRGINSTGLWWPHNGSLSWWLVSLEDGKRSLIRQYAPGWKNYIILLSASPGGRWICFWDSESANYFCIDALTGRTVNLTANLPETVANDVPQLIHAQPVGIAGWEDAESTILIYDNYDIWRLDPAGKKAPVNITGGYGRRHGIKLRFVYSDWNNIRPAWGSLLSGYDVISKCNGFFTIDLDKPGNPQPLTMGPYSYYQQTVFDNSFSNGMRPLFGGEGKNKRFIVMRESAAECPNFFVSKDMKEFEPLTNLHPQKDYNWLTTEAISWRMYNGQLNTGVLYKPENFDSSKKYPIIFNYYQRLSHRCYQFPWPALTTDNINIPWFVSRGYLVFTPDIQYTVANGPGGVTISEAAYNAVASAAEYLATRPYVDKSRMAVQGHSFGGHETNAIITQTSLFAAAAEMAGYSDHISAYLTLVATDEQRGIEKSDKIDYHNQRMGATPWERPDLFRLNSPVLHADKIETPLLIVHNKMDGSVNFRQGIEMYMAMRRLAKPCWLLQYDNSGHVFNNRNDALDYTMRLTQYFDHYLKGLPAPQWMTMNSLAGYKGKNNLYLPDTSGNCSIKCKVCWIWNNKKELGSR